MLRTRLESTLWKRKSTPHASKTIMCCDLNAKVQLLMVYTTIFWILSEITSKSSLNYNSCIEMLGSKWRKQIRSREKFIKIASNRFILIFLACNQFMKCFTEPCGLFKFMFMVIGQDRGTIKLTKIWNWCFFQGQKFAFFKLLL